MARFAESDVDRATLELFQHPQSQVACTKLPLLLRCVVWWGDGKPPALTAHRGQGKGPA
jgi:hypothetical protein